MRKHYLDNIRWVTVCLVFIYHVFYIFNGVGIPGGIPYAKSIPFFDTLAMLMYPWFMVLLFIVSGISARYALLKKSGKEFIKEKLLKLIIPATLGVFVIHWVTGYLNIKVGGGMEFIPKPLIYPISLIAGTGHLWYIQMLFVFSCIILFIKKIDKDRLYNKCIKIKTFVLISGFLLVFLSSQILNMPVITVYRFGIYFVSFLIGYFVLSHDLIEEKIERIKWISLFIAFVFGVIYAIMFVGTNFTLDLCLKNIITNIYLWFSVLAILGFFKKYFNKPVNYMNKASFGIYILHYPVLMVICYILTTYFNLPAFINYLLALIFGAVITFSLYEIIIRIPFVRFMVLGIKSKER